MRNLSILYLTALGLLFASSAKAQQFSVTNLVTNNQSLNTAVISDSAATNSWGISYGGTGPFWVSAEGSAVSNVYTVNATTNVPTKSGIQVNIPGNGSVTGQVNFTANAGQFNGDSFLFVSQDGTVSGWRGALGTTGTAEVLQASSTSNSYFGAAAAVIGGNDYLYAANFKNDTIDVLKGSGTAAGLSGSFTDPSLPAGYAPYNVQNLAGNLFVTYALQNSSSSAAVKAAGNGYVDEFDLQGNFLSRIGTQGTLNAPWGLAIAPSDFGTYSGDLLVGNFGGGAVNAFSIGTDTFVGQLDGTNSQPLAISGLWALTPGNGGSGGSSQSIYFTAGPNNQTGGVVGVLAPVPEPSTIALLGVGAIGILGYRWRKRK